jgi:hypothetical protein
MMVESLMFTSSPLGITVVTVHLAQVYRAPDDDPTSMSHSGSILGS